jgi:hypothetical protein
MTPPCRETRRPTWVPPSVARSLYSPSPHRRMRCRADVAKEMRPVSARVECRLCFPVDLPLSQSRE